MSLQKISLLAVVVVLTVVVTVRLSLNSMIKWAIDDFINNKTHFSGSIGKVELNLNKGQVSLIDLDLNHQGQKVFKLKKIYVDISWQALVDKKLLIEKIIIDRLDGSATYNDQVVSFNGVTADNILKEKSPEKKQPTEQRDSSFALQFKEIIIDQSNLNIELQEKPLQIAASKVVINRLYLDRPDLSADVDLEVTINGAKLMTKGQLYPFDRRQASSLRIDFSTDEVADLLAAFSGLSDAVPDLSGQLNISQEIILKLVKEKLVLSAEGTVNMIDGAFKQPASQTFSFAAIEANNKVSIDDNNFLIDLDISANDLLVRDKLKEQLVIQQMHINQLALEKSERIELVADRISFVGVSQRQVDKNHPRSNIELKQFQLVDDGFQSQQRQGAIRLFSKLGEFGFVTAAGTSRPGHPKPAIQFKLLTDAVDLTDFSGFFVENLGYTVDKGLLNIDLDIGKNSKELLDGYLKLDINKLEIDNKTQKGKDIDKKIGMPLATSLKVIKDKDDNIILEFPIDGYASDPKFQINEMLGEKLGIVLAEQLTSALANALIETYLPLLASSVVVSPTMAYSVIKKGYDFATKLRFEPLQFKVDEAALDNKSQKHLDDLVKVLKDKPNIVLNVCPVAYPFESVQNKELSQQKESSTSQKEKALSLANQRLDKVLDYVVKEKKVPARQLVPCKPRISKDASAQGRVEIYL